MKHLLTGVAMAAALAIAAPVWAQNAPMTRFAAGRRAKAPAAPAAKAPAPAAPMANAPAKPARTMTARKPMHHRHMAMRRMTNSGDQMTDQLNQQELQRITSGGPAPAPMGNPPPMGGNAPTSGNAGPFAPSGSAPPPPPK